MPNPFLCEDCQQLGYCRKYEKPRNTESNYRESPEFDAEFYNRVNNRPKQIKKEPSPISSKLTTLEKIRAQFRTAEKEEEPKPAIKHILKNVTPPPAHVMSRIVSLPRPAVHSKSSGISAPAINRKSRKKNPTA